MFISVAPLSTPRQPLIALCAVLLLAATAARADEIQDASKLLKAGQHQQALEQVNKILAAKPRDPQARFLKGLIYTEQGNTKEAIDVFAKLTQDFPALPEPYNNLAVIYAAQGQYEKARAALEQSIRTHPSYAPAYENLGDVYAKLASQAYDKALQLDSANTGAQNKLALVRELVGGSPTLGGRGGNHAAAREMGEGAARAHSGTQVDLGGDRRAEGQPRRRIAGERHVPPDLPLGRIQRHRHQDAGDGEIERPLADPAGKSRQLTPRAWQPMGARAGRPASPRP